MGDCLFVFVPHLANMTTKTVVHSRPTMLWTCCCGTVIFTMTMESSLKKRISKKLGIERDETLIKDGSEIPRLEKLKTFIWNPEDKAFLGRTALSWAKISLYYASFYAFLGAYFALLFGVFVATISKNLPTFYNTESVLDYKGVNPGMGFRPMDTSNLILLGTPGDNQKRFQEYIDYADQFLSQNTSVPNIINCMEDITMPLPLGKVCKYTFDDLISDENPCSRRNNGGYLTDSPCVIIKLNRIIGWVPTPGNSTLDPKLPENYVYFKCQGHRASDMDFFPNLTYYSMGTDNGSSEYGAIPYSYFPYYNIYNYVPPFVVVRFHTLPKDFVLNVLCKAYAPNIDNDDTINYRGMAYFQLFSKAT